MCCGVEAWRMTLRPRTPILRTCAATGEAKGKNIGTPKPSEKYTLGTPSALEPVHYFSFRLRCLQGFRLRKDRTRKMRFIIALSRHTQARPTTQPD